MIVCFLYIIGTRSVLPGVYSLILSRGHGKEVTVPVTIVIDRDQLVMSTMFMPRN